jgi:tripartite-type tricarboxylate transporter receptor subunit TctC
MIVSRLLRTAMTAALLVGIGSAHASDDYPSKAVTFVVPYPPGGMADRVARDVGAELQKRLKQPVIIENKPGAAGNIGFDSVARRPADGYTLVLAPASNLTVQTALFKKLTYDPGKDFAPVSMVLQTPQVLVAHPSLPVNSVKELVEYSKKNQGKLSYGATIGAYQHLATEMMKAQSGANAESIAYQGPAPALNDLLGGQIQFMFLDAMLVLEHIKAGKLKPLAVTSPARLEWLPNVPTMASLGYKDFEVASWYSVVVRTGTPKPIVDKLSKEIRSIVAEPEFRKRYDEIGAFATGSAPEQLQTFIRKESTRWLEVVKRVGIEPN